MPAFNRWSIAAVLCLAVAGAPAPAATSTPLKVTGQQAAKGTTQVVVGAFNVGFLFESIDNGKASGGLIGAFGGTTRAKSMLAGVTPAMMQAITDAAYADFRAQLAARGFTVIDSAALFSSAGFAKVKPVPSPYDANVALEKGSNGKTSFYKPSALPALVMIPGDFTASGLSGMGMTMAAGTTQYAMATHAKASGQAVLDVVYLVDFSNVKRPGAFSFGGINVNSGLSVTADYSKLNLITPAGKQTTITIKDPVAVEGDFVAMADSTGGANKALQTAGNVLGGVAAAFGAPGMMFGKSRTFTFTAKPGPYEQGAIKAATLANARLIDQLAALR